MNREVEQKRELARLSISNRRLEAITQNRGCRLVEVQSKERGKDKDGSYMQAGKSNQREHKRGQKKYT